MTTQDSGSLTAEHQPPPRPAARGCAADDHRPGIALRTPYWVFTGGLAVIFLFPAGLDRGLVGVAAPGHEPDRRLGVRQLRVARALPGRASGGTSPTRASSPGSPSLMTLAISLLGGYAFARFKFPGKNALFLLTLAILMVPYATLLIPLYVLLNDLGLSNSLIGVALRAHGVPAAVLDVHDADLVRVACPRELDEAAMVDGCSPFSGRCGGCCCPA